MNKESRHIALFSVTLVVIFCASFVFFYHQALRPEVKRTENKERADSLINQPLPEARLSDPSGMRLEDEKLRRGKRVLVFVQPDCHACLRESEFLKSVISTRGDVVFYGVISYGNKKVALEMARKEFPFDVFYDDGFNLAGKLGINRVPIKIFLEDGVIRKIWAGATSEETKKEAFTEWLRNC